MNHNYGKNGEMKANRGKVHKYLGMKFNFTEKGRVRISMDNCVEKIIEKLPTKKGMSDTALTPDGNNLLKKGNKKMLGKKETE